MSYFILNGKKYESGKGGILITALPTIKKPAMRTNVEEIDGRDGNIVTNLGFSAYTKTLKLALIYPYSEYRTTLNDLLADLAVTSGTIVFSNEPSYVYDYHLTGEVEFEKLVRFKEMEIEFEVQPFKHLLNEGNITLAAKKTINNNGNYFSKPTYDIVGSGTVTVTVNSNAPVTIDMSSASEIIIDSEELNAYFNGNYLNRIVTGEYSNLWLNKGSNTITISGMTSGKITKVSRWI